MTKVSNIFQSNINRASSNTAVFRTNYRTIHEKDTWYHGTKYKSFCGQTRFFSSISLTFLAHFSGRLRHLWHRSTFPHPGTPPLPINTSTRRALLDFLAFRGRHTPLTFHQLEAQLPEQICVATAARGSRLTAYSRKWWTVTGYGTNSTNPIPNPIPEPIRIKHNQPMGSIRLLISYIVCTNHSLE